jgi:hypothetical protein
MTRATLPTARPSVTTTVHWNGHAFPVTIGLSWPDLKPMEVFADVAKGGDMQWAIADACVVISLALQHGIPPADLGKSLGRVPVMEWDTATEAMVEVLRPASPLGAVVEAIMQEAKG